jgi:hypothetical protein
VEQAARALYRSAQGQVTGVFNVASPNATFGQAASYAAGLFGAQVVSDQESDPCSYQVDSAAARSAGLLDEHDCISLVWVVVVPEPDPSATTSWQQGTGRPSRALRRLAADRGGGRGKRCQLFVAKTTSSASHSRGVGPTDGRGDTG